MLTATHHVSEWASALELAAAHIGEEGLDEALQPLIGRDSTANLSAEELIARVARIQAARNELRHYGSDFDWRATFEALLAPRIAAATDGALTPGPDVDAWAMRMASALILVTPAAGISATAPAFLLLVAATLLLELRSRGIRQPAAKLFDQTGTHEDALASAIRPLGRSTDTSVQTLVERTPVDVVSGLLLECFDWRELSMFVYSLPDGNAVLASLPCPNTPAGQAFDLVLALERRGQLDDAFWAYIVEKRPRRREQVEAARELYVNWALRQRP